MIIGKVGSGKSTLLKGLIGELPVTAGSVQRKFMEVGYCEQQAWLVNDTIQSNILGQSALEARWYVTVVKACALDRDFAYLPLGELSVTGSKGISLSGGQKQRVVSLYVRKLSVYHADFQALARAICSKKDVVVIDDVLSGLDWATQESVWTDVLGRNGLFRQHGVTVVLATHAGKFPPM
jgi:ATP-binding cassette subfamily C (CFTR/MRP) protein 1